MNRLYQLDDETVRTLVMATQFAEMRTNMSEFERRLGDARSALRAQNAEIDESMELPR